MKYKRILAPILVLLLILNLSACGPTVSIEANAKESPGIDQSKFTWQIEVINAVAAESLHTSTGIVQYDGSVQDMVFDDKPSSGNEFIIITMNINKAKAGGGKFVWGNLSLKDNAENKYYRMQDDDFLSDHTYKRLSGTDLSLGLLKGSICFEVPAGTDVSDYTLEYDTGSEGLNTIPLLN